MQTERVPCSLSIQCSLCEDNAQVNELTIPALIHLDDTISPALTGHVFLAHSPSDRLVLSIHTHSLFPHSTYPSANCQN